MSLVVPFVAFCGALVPEVATADSSPLSTELRIGFYPPSYRWSNGLPFNAANAEKSLYASTALGARFYPRDKHGATIEVDYRFDIDVDSFCLNFSGTDICGPGSQIDFVTVHAGYAYRHIVHPKRKPYMRAWAFTPHVSFATGAALSRLSDAGLRDNAAVIGGRVGFDVDFHINRFFLGWGVSHEILGHVRSAIRYSHFFGWNLIPIFRMGGVIGRRVQPEPPKYPEFPHGTGSR